MFDYNDNYLYFQSSIVYNILIFVFEKKQRFSIEWHPPTLDNFILQIIIIWPQQNNQCPKLIG